MIPPIPKSLLPDDMEVRVPLKGDYGPKFGEPITVRHVRFDRKAGVSEGGSTVPEGRSYVLSDGPRGTVFIDRINSQGAFAVPVGSRVSIGGEELSVRSVEELRESGGRVHHWEVQVA